MTDSPDPDPDPDPAPDPAPDPIDDPAPDLIPGRLRNVPSRLLGFAALHGDRLVSEGLAAVGARKWHYPVLAALQEHGPASQAELSRRAGIYRSDMVAVLNELADGGYVERTPDRADKRRNVITLTDRGRGRLDQLGGLIDTFQGELLAPLTADERQELVRLLAVLVAHHGTRM